MTLKELRKQNKLTQKQCADYLGIPLRTYQNYENDVRKSTSMKYLYMLEKMEGLGYVDEEHGILTIEQIKAVCNEVFEGKDIRYCYLFGSYAKGKATEVSDVDLFISTPMRGLDFVGLIEELREAMRKQVELIKTDELTEHSKLLDEILKDGIKVYDIPEENKITIETIRNAVLNIVDNYPIKRVTLFGSRAAGTNRDDSDVDLIIEFTEPVTLITLSNIKFCLEEILGIDVDIVHGPIRKTDMIEIGKETELYAA